MMIREVARSLEIHDGGRFNMLLPVFAAIMAGMITPEIAKAESPTREIIATAENLGDASLAMHVNGHEAIAACAEKCKAAYEVTTENKDDVQKKQVWLVVDTALSSVPTIDHHIKLARDGYDALKTSFAGSDHHPRVAHFINNQNENSGVSLRPVNGSGLERVLLLAEPLVKDGGKILRQTVTLDFSKDDPSFKDIRETIITPSLRAAFRGVDTISLGYSASRRTSGDHVWEFNGNIGFATEKGSAVVIRGSTGIATILSPIEGGRTTVGVASELSLGHGALDYAAGSYLQTSLGAGRPDLIISTLVNPNDGNLEIQSQMALRFSLADLQANRANRQHHE